MPEVNPGSVKYHSGMAPGYEAGESISAGDSVALDGDGNVVKTTGSNGFYGISAGDAEAGELVAVQRPGNVVRANVTAGVEASNAVEPSSGTPGALTAATETTADYGDMCATEDADADGFALVSF